MEGERENRLFRLLFWREFGPEDEDDTSWKKKLQERVKLRNNCWMILHEANLCCRTIGLELTVQALLRDKITADIQYTKVFTLSALTITCIVS